MGKSPGRWIKTLLFGKKTRSHATRTSDASKAANDKRYAGGEDPIVALDSSVLSEPVPMKNENSGVFLTSDKENPERESNALVTSNISQGFRESTATKDTSIDIEEQAAIKAQAAFRGYLARRAFRALKGIIRLQALIRGHLVRRQAVATLYAMEGIVKLQAIARGKKVRSSFTEMKVVANFSDIKIEAAKAPLNVKLSSNAFVVKLIASPVIAKPLQIQYDKGDPNSVFSWLERWTIIRFWQPIGKSKKVTDSERQKNQINLGMEIEFGKSRHTVRINPSNVGAGKSNTNYEPEKQKKNLKKVPGSPAEMIQEHPQSELERVKRNLRKISSATKDASKQPELETQKSDASSKKLAAIGLSENLGQGSEEFIEKPKKDDALLHSLKLDIESPLESLVAERPVDVLVDDKSADELQLLNQIDNAENTILMNGHLSMREDQLSHENQKISKRRSSFSAKSEHPENGLPNVPVLPSYMAATESAKAKLKGQISPRLVSESVDKGGFTRRHSLPSSINSKMNSPRTKRPIQSSARGGFNRDINDKAIQVGWRR